MGIRRIIGGTKAASAQASKPREQGFTLLELTVALAISTTLLILVLQLLDLNQRVGRVQTDLAAVQQTERAIHNLLAESVRLAGRGGLATEWALGVRNNVPDDFEVAGNPTVDGSDVLRIRGILEGLYVVDSEDASTFDYDETTQTGTVIVESMMPTAIAPQPLDLIEEALDDARPVALMIVSATNAGTYGVVELRANSTVVAADVNGDGTTEEWEKRGTLRFSTDTNQGTYNGDYLAMSSTGAWPDTLTTAGIVGILQEYQFYVRDTNTAVDGNRPKLSRAEFYPGTTIVVGDAANGRIDLADHVIDLQIARAFDRDGDLMLDEDFENPENDEWLGNHTGDGYPDVDEDAVAEPVATYAAANWDLALITHLAISTLVQVERPDLGYISPAIDDFEDHSYDEAVSPSDADTPERRYRRRTTRTVVDMRNL